MTVDEAIAMHAAAERTLRERADLAYRRARRDVYDVERDISFRLSPLQNRRVADLKAALAALEELRFRAPLFPAQRTA